MGRLDRDSILTIVYLDDRETETVIPKSMSSVVDTREGHLRVLSGGTEDTPDGLRHQEVTMIPLCNVRRWHLEDVRDED